MDVLSILFKFRMSTFKGCNREGLSTSKIRERKLFVCPNDYYEWLVGWVYSISTFVGYLMPNPF